MTLPLFSFHLAESPVTTSAGALLSPPDAGSVPGLQHAEPLAAMELGSPILSPARFQVHNLALFAAWDDEAALDAFLAEAPLGQQLQTGWHVRLAFLRRWGRVPELPELPAKVGAGGEPDEPVVAVTLARVRPAEVPRFIRWGLPVERLVRDHPGATLALAANRPPNTVCTFSVWETLRDMTDMVRGHSAVPDSDRHATAMVERDRRGFHFSFTTLRFRALAEHGAWKGRGDYVPGLR